MILSDKAKYRAGQSFPVTGGIDATAQQILKGDASRIAITFSADTLEDILLFAGSSGGKTGKFRLPKNTGPFTVRLDEHPEAVVSEWWASTSANPSAIVATESRLTQ